MRRIFLTLAVLPVLVFSQPDVAKKQIKELKNSVLLVRLMTSENTIKALEQAGEQEKAKQVKEQREEKNREIAAAFSENFTFCPVFFFYSSASEDIKKSSFQGNLMDKNLKPLQKIPGTWPVFFVADFATIEQTDEKYRDSYELRDNDQGGKDVATNYNGSPDMGFPALIMKDMNFVQLRDPFPYYVRTYESLSSVKRSTGKAVSKLNKKLQEYYNSTVKK